MESGQIVVFELNNQKYALPIHDVSEIIRIMEVTGVPNMEHFYKGIINLRGSVVPVMSLSLRLGLEESELSKDSRIIVVEKDEQKLGLIVDCVYSVTQYSEDQVEEPECVSDEDQFINGIVHQENDMTLLLDLKKLVS